MVKTNETPGKKKIKKVKTKKIRKIEAPLDPTALRYLKYKIGKQYTAERHLFLKRDLSGESSIIVSNIPAFLGEDIALEFIKKLGEFDIEESFVQRSNATDNSLSQGQLTISINFVKPESVDEILKKCPNAEPFIVADFFDVSEFPSVLKDATSLYHKLFPSEEQIEEMAAEYIEQYDEAQAEARREAKRKHSEPDEDGWITVTKKSKTAKVVKLRKDEIPMMGGLNNKDKKLDLAFYTFQAKESKQKKAQDLLKKFEEDKKRIAQLKQARNFKPA